MRWPVLASKRYSPPSRSAANTEPFATAGAEAPLKSPRTCCLHRTRPDPASRATSERSPKPTKTESPNTEGDDEGTATRPGEYDHDTRPVATSRAYRRPEDVVSPIANTLPSATAGEVSTVPWVLVRHATAPVLASSE